jgi:hypothetical protein
MAGKPRATNPKKKNRHSDTGILLPGIRAVRVVRTRLMDAQKRGAPEEELEALRRELREKKRVAKKSG